MAQSIFDQCVASAKAVGQLPLPEAGGIGVVLSTDVSSLRLLKVVPGSPAAMAGMKPGDTILMLDDQVTANQGDARRMMFGRRGTPIKVTFRSDGVEKSTTIMRGSISALHAP